MSTIVATPTIIPTHWASSILRRISVDEYERIVQSGALTDPDRIELINGFLVQKMAKSPQHGYATRKLIDDLGVLIGPGRTWRAEQPIRIPGYDEPEPDIAIARGSTEDYAFRIPEPGDVLLLVEISLTTLDYDRTDKGAAYAGGRIPVYWIVNLVHRQIEVHTDPTPTGYRTREVFSEGESVPVVIDGRKLGEVSVSGILPPTAAPGSAGTP